MGLGPRTLAAAVWSVGRSGLWRCAILLAGWAVLPVDAQDRRSLFHEKPQSPWWETWLHDTKHSDPRKVFTIEKGALRISGDGFGYIASTARLRDYRLQLEFKWGDQKGLDRRDRKGKALDSGVFLHATGPHGNSADGDGAYMAAVECNVMEGATGDILLIRGEDKAGSPILPTATVEARKERDEDGFPFWEKGGKKVTLKRWGRINWKGKAPNWRDRRGVRGSKDVEKPPGEWNRLKCLCRDDTITIILNGVTVNYVTNVWPTRGRVLLQCEGAEIHYRNVTIEALPGSDRE